MAKPIKTYDMQAIYKMYSDMHQPKCRFKKGRGYRLDNISGMKIGRQSGKSHFAINMVDYIGLL